MKEAQYDQILRTVHHLQEARKSLADFMVIEANNASDSDTSETLVASAVDAFQSLGKMIFALEKRS